MKQVNGIKFYEPKNNQVKIVYADGKTEIKSVEEAEKLYAINYAHKNADKICDETLKELGLNIKTAHLLDKYSRIELNGKVLTHYYAGSRETVTSPRAVFEERLQNNLYKNKITLPYMSVITNKYKLDIGGNSSAIAYMYSNYIWGSPWKDCTMTRQEMEYYLKRHKKVRTFKKESFEIVECKREEILKEVVGTRSNSRGYGSQSSIAETTVKFKKDDMGNILLDKYTLIYD